MNKRNYILVSFLYLASLASLLSTYSIYTVGWGNGAAVSDYNPYSYSFNFHYATHDWIPESALEILFQKLSGGEKGYAFVQDLHNNIDNYKNYFLLGTEIPDRRYNHGAIFSIKTKCGLIRHDDVTQNKHQLRFTGNMLQSDRPSQFLCIEAKRMGDSVVKAFGERDCQKAAFFLGCMSHYIADATFYTHLINNENSHTSYLNKVQSITKTRYSYADIKRQLEFFNIIESYDSFHSNIKKKPYDSAYLAGLDTRYGNYYLQSFTSTQYENAEWLDFYAPSGSDPKFWNLPGFNPINRPTSGNAKKYFDTVEHNLNTAIYYTAAAINFLIDNYNGKNCQGDGDQYNPMDPFGGVVGDKVGVRVKEYTFLFLWQFMGMISIITAMTIVKQLKVVAPLLF